MIFLVMQKLPRYMNTSTTNIRVSITDGSDQVQIQPVFNNDRFNDRLQPWWETQNLFRVKGCSILLSVHSSDKDKIMIGTFESQVSKTENKIYLNSLVDGMCFDINTIGAVSDFNQLQNC